MPKGNFVHQYRTDNKAEVFTLIQSGFELESKIGKDAVFTCDAKQVDWINKNLDKEADKAAPLIDALEQTQQLYAKADAKPAKKGAARSKRLSDEDLKTLVPDFKAVHKDVASWTKSGNLSSMGITKLQAITKKHFNTEPSSITCQKYAEKLKDMV